MAVLPTERIVGVQTGCCPHTAIRDDISENLDAVEGLERTFAPDVVLVESGGDNLTATFSEALVDVQVFVIDVAGGDKVPRKGGPGITTSDLLVINKVDLAPLVGRRPRRHARPTPAGCGATGPPSWCRCATTRGPRPIAAWVRSLLAAHGHAAHEHAHDLTARGPRRGRGCGHGPPPRRAGRRLGRARAARRRSPPPCGPTRPSPCGRPRPAGGRRADLTVHLVGSAAGPVGGDDLGLA